MRSGVAWTNGNLAPLQNSFSFETVSFGMVGESKVPRENHLPLSSIDDLCELNTSIEVKSFRNVFDGRKPYN